MRELNRTKRATVRPGLGLVAILFAGCGSSNASLDGSAGHGAIGGTSGGGTSGGGTSGAGTSGAGTSGAGTTGQRGLAAASRWWHPAGCTLFLPTILESGHPGAALNAMSATTSPT
jgi:hypothetical protein